MNHKYMYLCSKNRSKRETAASFYQGAETINHRRKREFIISLGFPAYSAVVRCRFFPTARTSKKQKEYKDDNLRLSPLAQRIDFTGFHERTQ